MDLFCWPQAEQQSGVIDTFYPLTQSVEMLHGAAVTLLALALCVLLQSCHREGLLQCQHDLIHLPECNGIDLKCVNNYQSKLGVCVCVRACGHRCLSKAFRSRNDHS